MTKRKASAAATPGASAPPARRRNRKASVAVSAVLRGRILELRTQGLTIQQIGKEVKRSPSVVHGHLQAALHSLDQEHLDKANGLRALAYNRLERLLASAMAQALPSATTDDKGKTSIVPGDLKAMREAARLIQTQARVMGFDAPIKTAATDPTGEFTAPPGTWTLPARPEASIEEWQAAAQAVWDQQQKRAEKAS